MADNHEHDPWAPLGAEEHAGLNQPLTPEDAFFGPDLQRRVESAKNMIRLLAPDVKEAIWREAVKEGVKEAEAQPGANIKDPRTRIAIESMGNRILQIPPEERGDLS